MSTEVAVARKHTARKPRCEWCDRMAAFWVAWRAPGSKLYRDNLCEFCFAELAIAYEIVEKGWLG